MGYERILAVLAGPHPERRTALLALLLSLEPSEQPLLAWRGRQYVPWHAQAIGQSQSLPGALPL
jgi:hypothetical protein